MSDPYVTTERNGPIAIVRFDRGENLNAFDGQLILELAHAAAEMPPLAVRMIKEAVNATANTLNRTASYADADQSKLAAASADAKSARDRFNRS